MALAALAAFAPTLLPIRPARADQPPPGWPRVDVSVRSPGLPVLERTGASDGAWIATCVPPCARYLDPDAAYRVAGPGLVTSDPFRVPADVARARVDVVGGSPLLRDIGTSFLIGGTLFAGAGGGVLLLPDDASNSHGDKIMVGVTLLTFGVLTVAVGIVARIAAETRVTVSPATVPEGR